MSLFQNILKMVTSTHKSVPVSARPSDREELAEVVIAAETHDSRSTPWYVRLRVWLFCLGFLLIAEAGARVAFDGTTCLHNERFDNFPNPAALDAFVSQIKRDPAYRVVVLGDSVVVGPSLLEKDETIPAYLEAALQKQMPGKPVHVWNLGIAGARSTDLYCLLLKILEAKPDFVVLETNLMMFTMDIRLRPVANHWLAYSLSPMPDVIKPLVPERNYKQLIEDGTTWFAESNSRLFGLRQAINGTLFGVQPRVPFETPNPAIMLATRAGQKVGKLKMEPWSVRGYRPASFRNTYGHPVEPDNLNGKFYPLMIDELKKHGIPTYVYMTPQNPVILDASIPRSFYMEIRQKAMMFVQSDYAPAHDYFELLTNSMFYDNDHLLAIGNKTLADKIAKDIAPIISGASSKQSRISGKSSQIAAFKPHSVKLSGRANAINRSDSRL